MLETLRNHRLNRFRCFGSEPEETRGLHRLCETWVAQVCSKIKMRKCPTPAPS